MSFARRAELSAQRRMRFRKLLADHVRCRGEVSNGRRKRLLQRGLAMQIRSVQQLCVHLTGGLASPLLARRASTCPGPSLTPAQASLSRPETRLSTGAARPHWQPAAARLAVEQLFLERRVRPDFSQVGGGATLQKRSLRAPHLHKPRVRSRCRRPPLALLIRSPWDARPVGRSLFARGRNVAKIENDAAAALALRCHPGRLEALRGRNVAGRTRL